MWIVKILMPHLITSQKLDLFFAPSHYLPLVTRCPKVCTIHDLGYLRDSEQFKKKDYWQLKYWTDISIRLSKNIIAVSNSAKEDILRRYKFSRKKIDVIYHGIDKKRYNYKIHTSIVRHVLKKYKINQDNYFLFLSRLKPSKNIEGLIQAYSKIKTDDSKLVIAGSKGWLYESVYKKADQLGIKDKIIFTGYVEEEDKPGLYKGAIALVSPSFWEGFGMHVLEAMACGTPVIISKIASLPEVGGDAAIYVNPYKIETISKAMHKILTMSKREYKNLTTKCLRQSDKFDWDKVGDQTLSTFEKSVKM